jgi:3-keto-5-aminohexanoate cleavage enzyme
MDSVIITSNDPMVGNSPSDIERVIEEGVKAAEAGAAILHHHLIYKKREPGRLNELDFGPSVEILESLKEKTDAILQLGITTATNESRMAVAKAASVEMFSITLADNDHYGRSYPTIFRDREDMEQLARFCLDNGIVPEWEIFHSGAAWNLHYLIKKGLAKPPYFINLTMYPEGSSWSPRTFAEMDHRVTMLPENSIWHLIAFAKSETERVFEPITSIDHVRLMTYALLKGGHVRTGKEERPERRPGIPTQWNAELVTEIADISQRLERPIATPDEARRLLGISKPA